MGGIIVNRGYRLWQRLRAITRVTATCAVSANSPTCLHLFLYSFLKNKTSCTEVLLIILSPIETCLFDKRKYFHSNHLMMQILNLAFATCNKTTTRQLMRSPVLLLTHLCNENLRVGATELFSLSFEWDIFKVLAGEG